MSNNKQKKEREEVENILKKMEQVENSDNPIKELTNIEIPDKKDDQVSFINYKDLQIKCNTEAENTVENWINYHLENIDINLDYLSNKKINDILILSALLFQIKTASHAISKLLHLIDAGDATSRNFEVLSGLQKSQMEIVKHLIQSKTVMEDSYRELYENHVSKRNLLNESNEENFEENFNASQSHKTLLENLDKQIKEEETDYVEIKDNINEND